MYRYLIILCFVFLAAACSSTDEPVDTKGIKLGMTSSGKSGNVAVFQLRVLKDGIPLPNAHLSERYYPKNLTDTLPSVSDSAGYFNFHKILDDSVTKIAFQAFGDSGVSNFILWP